MTYDILIKNGTIIDGSGGEPFRGEIAIQGGRIAAVGQLDGQAKRVLDASGLTVTPGFIDVHTHYDAQILWDPMATPSCWYGVTSVITGNCGFTIAPCRPDGRTYITEMLARVEGMSKTALEKGIDWRWETFPQYLDVLEERLGVNVASYVGHSAIRSYVMGDAAYERGATDNEINEMKRVLDASLAGGAVGFSTSRATSHWGGRGEPVPSRKASEEEILQLASVLKRYPHRLLAIAPGDLNKATSQSLLRRMSVLSGHPVVWNEMFYAPNNPTGWRRQLEFTESSSEGGASIYTIVRCQPAKSEFSLKVANVFNPFPVWQAELQKPTEEKKRRLADPTVREALKREIDEDDGSRPVTICWEKANVLNTALSENKGLEGRVVAELAFEAGVDPVDYVLDLGLSENLETTFTMTTRNDNEEAIAEMVRSPRALAGISDAGAHNNADTGAHVQAYFLSYWARDRGVLSVQEAVRRLTSQPASISGLHDRGLLKPGMAADVVVFDLTQLGWGDRYAVHDMPGGEARLVRDAAGVHWVMVNGDVIVEHGNHTGAYPGQVLRANSRD